MTIKIRFFSIFQLLLKVFICVACFELAIRTLCLIPFVNNGINFVVNKLDWKNYGIWFWHMLGFCIALIWQIVYEFKEAKRRKNSKQIILKEEN